MNIDPVVAMECAATIAAVIAFAGVRLVSSLRNPTRKARRELTHLIASERALGAVRDMQTLGALVTRANQGSRHG
jgi:hypothetical protein